MLIFNNFIFTLLSNIEIINSIIIEDLILYIIDGLFIISIIYLSTTNKVKGAIDIAAKVIGIAAGTSVVHKN
jgi:hypothetical protein